MVPHRNAARVLIDKVESGVARSQQDVVAVEEPLEIRLQYLLNEKPTDIAVSITMRTPGEDFALAAGFLFGEGIVHERGDIQQITYCVGAQKEAQQYNVVRVQLSSGCQFDPAKLARNFYTTSSCGVCGKASIDALRPKLPKQPAADSVRVAPAVLSTLAGKLRSEQTVFEKTGGLHAAGLFDCSGNLVSLHEDVGRHNAVDKLIGTQFLNGKTPLPDKILMLSGRASFELVQKAVAAGIPLVAAVGAPSSLAVDLAKEFGITLVGFLRDERFNIYAGAERIEALRKA